MLAYIDPGTGFTVTTLGGWLLGLLLGLLGFLATAFKRIIRNFRRRRARWRGVLLSLLVLGALAAVLLMPRTASPFDHKIIILGFDGLSPELIEPMMAQGALPHFTQLQQLGSYRRLATTNPAQSPVAWTGFATGENPGKHGIFDFILRDPKTYELRLSLSNIEHGKPRRVIMRPTFWEYASALRVPVVLLGGPMTFPPGKINGRVLSGMGVPDFFGSVGASSFYTSEPAIENREVGGHVFSVTKAPVMVMSLLGPKVERPGRAAEPVKVPFKVLLEESRERVTIQYQGQSFELPRSQWSAWKEVTFDLGPFNRKKGILKFYLVETSPAFKLYASPINFDPRAPYFPISYPQGYSRELAERIGLYHTAGMPLDTGAVNTLRLPEGPFVEQAVTVFEEKNRMLNFELSRFSRGILFAYFECPDIIQHMFWRYLDPEHPLYEPDAPQAYRDLIRSWYIKLDGTLGRVMQTVGTDDVLLVLSDHGMDTFRREAHLNAWLKQQGFLALRPDAPSTGGTWKDIDWSRTQAYAIGLGGMYINQAGRERDGIVQPGADTQRLKEHIAEQLLRWRDNTHHNRPIVNRVYAREEIFWGDRAQEAPDLSVGFQLGYSASRKTALGDIPGVLVEDNRLKWSGTHLVDPPLTPGILFCNRRVTKADPSIYDVAPTVLRLVGYGTERLKALQLDGQSLFD